jgi:hypothetical protein
MSSKPTKTTTKAKDPKDMKKATSSTRTKTNKDPDVKKAKSGYNVFMAEKMKQLKEEDQVEGKERLKVVGGMWKELTDKEKEKYNDLAAEMNEEEGREVVTKSKSKSKYSAASNTKKGKDTKDAKDTKKDDKKKDDKKKDDKKKDNKKDDKKEATKDEASEDEESEDE